MRNVLLRSTSIAVLGFGLAAAPLAFAQDTQTTPPAATTTAPTTGTAPDPNTTVPERMDDTATQGTMGTGTTGTGTMGTTDPMGTTGGTLGTAATGTDMDGQRVSIVGGTQPMGTVLATELQGEPVENAAGEDLATLDDFVIDEQGRIVGAVVSFGGFLGMGQKSVLLPWDDLQIDGQTAAVRLSMTSEQIEALPDFERVERQNEALVNDPARTTAPAPAPTGAPVTTTQ
jgi:sporulation protein YlmC with PRC-barrel domain